MATREEYAGQAVAERGPMGSCHPAPGLVPRRATLVIVAAVAALAMPGAAVASTSRGPRAADTDFPRGSLALGHPVLHREQSLSDGVMRSRVVPAARAEADAVLVRFTSGAGPALRAQIRARRGLSLIGALPRLPVLFVRVRRGERQRLLRWLRRQRGVRSVQSDATESEEGGGCPPGTACTIPDDPGFGYQWYLYNAAGVTQPPSAEAPVFGADVDAPRAWADAAAGQPVRIAVLDSGIDGGHPDLAGKLVAAANFTASNTAQDLSGHGTHVAGIAAADFDNATGIAGMAPHALLMDVKVLATDATGRTSGDCADVADGVVWATDHGANVLNLSLGSRSACEALALAVEYASSHGALVIAAAGNDATTTRFYPAAFANVLSVAATTNRDQIAPFSNRGADWVDVAAPGAGIVSTLPTSDNATGAVGYGYLSGTSMAAPLVSGIAALVWGEMPPGTTARDVEARIIGTAQPTSGTGTLWRYGRVDACRAVGVSPALCAAAPTTGPAPPSTAPPPPETAQPAPLPAPPAVMARRHAAPGRYVGRLGRTSGRLQLLVGDGGDALLAVRATVQVSCGRSRRQTVQVRALDPTRFAPIKVGGRFGLRVGTVTTALGRSQLQLAGRFDLVTRRAQGTLRVTARTRRGARCDSRSIRYVIRL